MSNCLVRSCGSRLPCSFVADHGIEGGDHLSHDGDDNDFRFLVGCGETIVKDLEGGIVSQYFANPLPTSTVFCAARNRAICHFSSQRRTDLSSTSKPRRHSA